MNLVQRSENLSVWHLDSRATHHISGNSSVFCSLESKQCSGVKSAGGQGYEVLGFGDVDILFPASDVHTISQVVYSPSIKKNLRSVGIIADHDHNLEFLSEGYLICNRHTKELVAFAPRKNGRGLYKLEVETVIQPEVNSVTMERSTSSDIWHLRLDHYHLESIRRMIRVVVVRGLPPLRIIDRPCVTCFQGK